MRVVLALLPPYSEKYCSFTEKCNANYPKNARGDGHAWNWLIYLSAFLVLRHLNKHDCTHFGVCPLFHFRYDQCARETAKVGDVKGISLGCVMKADCKRLEDNCNKWSSKARSCKVECCQKDACNDSVLVNYNFLLLAICIIISLWL